MSQLTLSRWILAIWLAASGENPELKSLTQLLLCCFTPCVVPQHALGKRAGAQSHAPLHIPLKRIDFIYHQSKFAQQYPTLC
jgi:hypothetical protein